MRRIELMDAETEYSKAPITEALLDIQVEPSPNLFPSMLAVCQDSVVSEYPTKRDVKAAFAQIDLSTNIAAASASSQELGYAFVSQDGKQLFQVRTNGFTTNRLSPYSNWKSFSQEAKRLWQIYRGVANPNRVTRIALRYINRFDIPTPLAELKDYFQTTPEIAQALPQMMAGFFMQITLPLEDVKASLNIVETIVQPLNPDTVSVVLDLDFFRTSDIPESEEELWKLFEALRVKKNEVFEACITEKTRELIR